MGQASTFSFAPSIQEIPQSSSPGFTPVYRKVGVKELQWKLFPQVNNIYDLMKHAVQNSADLPALGYVSVQKYKNEQGEERERRMVQSWTFRQLFDLSFQLGRALHHRSLFFSEPIHGMKLMGIYSKNRYEWILADQACLHFGIVMVPLYDTLGIENLSYCLNLTQVTSLFVSADTVKILLKLKQLGNLTHLISFDPLPAEIEKQATDLKLKVIYLNDLLEEGKKLNHVTNEHVKYQPQDCFTFCFTSGTTGPPKGAMLSHQNILAFITGVLSHKDVCLTPHDVYLSYLPLPHSMERCISMGILGVGAHFVCFSGDIAKIKEDCQVVRPTVFISVPRLYNRIVEGVKAKFDKEEGLKKWIINKGVNSKLAELHSTGQYTNIFYDKVLFSKIRETFGGRIRVLASGSAPLSPEVHEFMMAIMCCPLIEGYGSTESSAGIMYSSCSDPHHGQFAELTNTVEIKLNDIPEMNYTSTDLNSEGKQSPRGELWIRGPQIFLGYYKQDEKTKETLTEDGWLKTGDVVQIQPGSNAIKIIDRKKNIFKLQQGEYIAPEKIEQIYCKQGLLSQVYLHGDSTQNYSVLIATPNRERFLQLAQESGLEGNYSELCMKRAMRESVLRQINNFGKKSGLNSLELSKNIFFEEESFLSRNILTNTMKLIRFKARQVYHSQIEKMYEEGPILEHK